MNPLFTRARPWGLFSASVLDTVVRPWREAGSSRRPFGMMSRSAAEPVGLRTTGRVLGSPPAWSGGSLCEYARWTSFIKEAGIKAEP